MPDNGFLIDVRFQRSSLVVQTSLPAMAQAMQMVSGDTICTYTEQRNDIPKGITYIATAILPYGTAYTRKQTDAWLEGIAKVTAYIYHNVLGHPYPQCPPTAASGASVAAEPQPQAAPPAPPAAPRKRAPRCKAQSDGAVTTTRLGALTYALGRLTVLKENVRGAIWDASVCNGERFTEAWRDFELAALFDDVEAAIGDLGGDNP